LVLAFWVGIGKNGVMQGRSDPNVELLDAAVLCGHLVAEGSVHAFLADHRRDLFPDEMFADLFLSGRGGGGPAVGPGRCGGDGGGPSSAAVTQIGKRLGMEVPTRLTQHPKIFLCGPYETGAVPQLGAST
jgi:hypothetical protein